MEIYKQRMEILSKFTVEELSNPITQRSVIKRLANTMSTKDQLESLTNEGLEEYMEDEKDPYREYKDQEIKALNSK